MRAVRAAWVLATAHLGAHDRVGVVTFGGYPAWVRPVAVTRALRASATACSAPRAAWSEAQRSVNVLPRRAIPPGALVVGLSPLHDGRMVVALADLRHRGLEIAAVEIDVGTEVAAASRQPRSAGRRRAACGAWSWRGGAGRWPASASRSSPWPEGDDVALVLERLARARRRARRAMKRCDCAGLSLASALVSWPWRRRRGRPTTRRLTVETGVVGVVLLAAALLWRPVLLTPGADRLGARRRATMLVHHDAGVTAVIPCAALLLVAAELAGWSYDLRSVVPESGRARPVARLDHRRPGRDGALCVSASILAVRGLPAPGGILPELAGPCAALAVSPSPPSGGGDSRPLE